MPEMPSPIEETKKLTLDFDKIIKIGEARQPVIVAIAQHADNGKILMQGYATEEALKKSLSTGRATFFSTSRNEIWIKGSTSGDYLELVDVLVNCEQNSLLYLVRPAGNGVCHSKNQQGESRSTCYYRRLAGNELETLEP